MNGAIYLNTEQMEFIPKKNGKTDMLLFSPEQHGIRKGLTFWRNIKIIHLKSEATGNDEIFRQNDDWHRTHGYKDDIMYFVPRHDLTGTIYMGVEINVDE